MDLLTHHDRPDLSGEHRFGDAGQLILFILFMAVWITDSFVFKYSVCLNDYVPYSARLAVGVLVLLVSAYLAYDGIKIVFFKIRRTPAVIREGVFRFSRHPIYFGEMLLYLGLLIISMSLAGLAVWIIIIGFLHYNSRYEEKLLLARFGEEYRRYMQEVPMYFPRIFKRHLDN